MKSNSFTDQTSIFVNKHVPVQNQWNKHYQKIYDLFNLINEDATAMPLT